MATKRPKPPTYETWTQVAFSKTWNGCPETGIVQRQRFYEIPRAAVGQTVHLRRSSRNPDSTAEWSLDQQAWAPLRGGRAI